MTQRYVALQGGGGVYDPALRSVTGGWGGCMTQRYVMPAFILPGHFIIPCRFDLIQNRVPASQHLKVIRNAVCCHSSCIYHSKTLI